MVATATVEAGDNADALLGGGTASVGAIVGSPVGGAVVGGTGVTGAAVGFPVSGGA